MLLNTPLCLSNDKPEIRYAYNDIKVRNLSHKCLSLLLSTVILSFALNVLDLGIRYNIINK